MKNQIKAGAILIQEGTVVPKSLLLETDPYAAGWGSLKNLDRSALDDELLKAGWISLFHSSEIQTKAVGLDKLKAVRSAVRRLLASAESRCFNSLEVRKISTKSFLGVHAVMVFARPRHIQVNPVLSVP